MTIKNEFGSDVLVLFYKPTDTTYPLALSEVTISNDETKGYREDSFQQIKVSVRNGKSVFDPQIIKPGELFDMKADYTLTSDGKLVRAELTMQTIATDTRTIRTFEFFDARVYNEVTKRTIQSSFKSAYSQSQGFKSEFEEGIEIGAGISLSGKAEGVKVGISADFKSKTTNALTNNYEKSISQIWEKSTKDEFTFQPGFLYAIEVVWNVTVKTGVIAYLNERSEYNVIVSAEGSLTSPKSFASEGEMPEFVRAAFNQLATV